MAGSGSSHLPPGNEPPAAMSIGEVADPPFAVLPDPGTLFARRAARFAALAPGHALAPYLSFLGAVTAAQDGALEGLPAVILPDAVEIERALTHAMPPLPVTQIVPDAVFDATLTAFLSRLAPQEMPEAARTVLGELQAASAADRRLMAETVLMGAVPETGLGAHVLIFAALQVHFTRMAARLDAARLRPVADAVCPVCGSAPASSLIVGWPGAQGTRFCACPMCNSLWHAVRIKCLLCGDEKAIAYHGIEAGVQTVKAETCGSCRGYVKILYQHQDAALDPIADDVASLGLDLLLRAEDWHRGGANPFLAGCC